jgi:DNA-binding beta-propeller fold protein YncE
MRRLIKRRVGDKVRTAILVLALVASTQLSGRDLFVSANDDNQRLENGVQFVPKAPRPGSVSLIEFAAGKMRIVATIAAPSSVIGPPGSVAMTSDGRTAIVTASRRIDPADATKIIPDDRVTVIDLSGSPHVAQSLQAGAGAAGVAIDPAGRRVLVANRSAGTVSLFALEGGRLRALQTVRVGTSNSSPAQPLFFDGGNRALVTLDGDNQIAVVAVHGDLLHVAEKSVAPGLRPYGIDTKGGRFAVVGNIGGAGSDVDTISLIDLAGDRPRAVDSVVVGLTPEGVAMSPDGQFVAVNVNAGSNLARSNPHHSERGQVQIWRIKGARLRLVTSAPVLAWGQGLAWTRDGRTLLVQSMVGDSIASFGFDGARLTPRTTLRMPGGPAAIAGPVP